MARWLRIIFVITCMIGIAGCGTTKQESKEAGTVAQSIYDIAVQDESGKEVTLESYKGKVLLIVNVASRCGYTPQYEGLQTLYETYKDQGFAVLGFPSNDFGGQEPGTIEEIKEFCTLNYDVSFDLFNKVHATGADIHPLYQYLTANASPAGDVGWNFEKFLISKDGEIIARYKSSVKPEDESLVKAIEAAL